MYHEISITLKRNDWGQIIDGLICQAEQYELTARYHSGVSVDGEILDVCDANEARSLADWYHRIAEDIRRQLRDE
ncbi:MAG: hypothetical protein JXR25_03660 [Pontiellaceae bacterium]|nr:hypothetical protein [Pontiellaceae bacterium]